MVRIYLTYVFKLLPLQANLSWLNSLIVQLLTFIIRVHQGRGVAPPGKISKGAQGEILPLPLDFLGKNLKGGPKVIFWTKFINFFQKCFL